MGRRWFIEGTGGVVGFRRLGTSWPVGAFHQPRLAFDHGTTRDLRLGLHTCFRLSTSLCRAARLVNAHDRQRHTFCCDAVQRRPVRPNASDPAVAYGVIGLLVEDQVRLDTGQFRQLLKHSCRLVRLSNVTRELDQRQRFSALMAVFEEIKIDSRAVIRKRSMPPRKCYVSRSVPLPATHDNRSSALATDSWSVSHPMQCRPCA